VFYLLKSRSDAWECFSMSIVWLFHRFRRSSRLESFALFGPHEGWER
jgi:hypothetical protein